MMIRYNIGDEEKLELLRDTQKEAKANRQKLINQSSSSVPEATTMLYTKLTAIEIQKTNALLEELISILKKDAVGTVDDIDVKEKNKISEALGLK
jgi:hypothetical protein